MRDIFVSLFINYVVCRYLVSKITKIEYVYDRKSLLATPLVAC
jgi:hypothetical protein